MKDFGTLTTEYTSCSLCGSFRHTTVSHRALNDAAPELYDAALAVVNSTDYDDDKPLIRNLRAALAKADGREQ